MRKAEYLVIEQTDGWWVMLDEMGMGPYPDKTIATEWAVSTARILENTGHVAQVFVRDALAQISGVYASERSRS